MADTKVTGLTENSTPAAADLAYIVDDPGGTPASQKITLANLKTFFNDITTDAEWDAKGDLVAGTGANTADRLAVGGNNTVLMADSGEATGLKWSASPIVVDTVWDAKGDIVAGTAANTAARLAVGAANTFPMADAGETTGLKYALAPYHVCQGRLTLTTATPVTTADVTAAATLYFTPFRGNAIGLFDGTYWDILSFSEISLDISGYTASKPYDIWVYNNSGTATLDSTVWTNATTRATALTTQDGIYVKTGATTRRYVGTIYINASGGQTDDSVTKRNVWNYYNRVPRRFYLLEATSHTYNSTTIRPWNNDATVILGFTCGVLEDALDIKLQTYAIPVALTSPARVPVTFNGSTSLDNTLPWFINGVFITSSGGHNGGMSRDVYPPSVGYNYFGPMEQITGGSTGATFSSVHMSGHILG